MEIKEVNKGKRNFQISFDEIELRCLLENLNQIPRSKRIGYTQELIDGLKENNIQPRD